MGARLAKNATWKAATTEPLPSRDVEKKYRSESNTRCHHPSSRSASEFGPKIQVFALLLLLFCFFFKWFRLENAASVSMCFNFSSHAHLCLDTVFTLSWRANTALNLVVSMEQLSCQDSAGIQNINAHIV